MESEIEAIRIPNFEFEFILGLFWTLLKPGG